MVCEEESFFVPHLEVDVSLDNGALKEKNENQDVKGGGIENGNATKIPSNNGAGTTLITDHPSQMARNKVETLDNLNAKISSIGTRLKEITIMNDGRLTS